MAAYRDNEPIEGQFEPNTLIIENEALRRGFTIIPNYVLRNPTLSFGAKLTYTLLLSYAWQEGSCFPGQAKLALDLGVTRKAINAYLRDLNEKGYITWTRRGMGKTNIYRILDVQAKEQQPSSPPRAGGRAGVESDVTVRLHQDVTTSSHQDVTTGLHKKNSEEKDSEGRNIYPSKVRKAKSGEFGYVKDGSTAPALESARSMQNEKVGHSQPHSSTTHRNIEKIETRKTLPSAMRTNERKTTAGTSQRGDMEPISQTLQGRFPPADDTEAHEAIEAYIRDIAAKHHDAAPLKSSTTRAYNLYQRSGVHLGRFFNLMYDADKEASSRSATIKKLTAQGFKNRMAYFFALLEDKLGLREKSLHHSSEGSVGLC